jgi:hypothetical protein
MRYQQFMVEAIANRPRNWKLYLSQKIKELDRLRAMCAEAKQLSRANNRAGYDVLRSSLRYGSDDYETANDLYLLVDTDIDDHYRIEPLHHALESLLKFGPRDFLKYAMSTLDSYMRPVSDDYRATAAKLPYAEKGLIMYGYEEGNAEHEADEDYIAAKHLLRACRLYVEVVKMIEPMQDDLRKKLGAVQHMQNSPHQYNPEKYRPEHADIETLYHATAFVREVLQDGFSAEKPEDRVGVGNFGSQQLISFSHDIEIARTIMRSFKEIWMITHGHLTAEKILHWAKVEGILDDLKKSWRGLTHDPMPSGRDADPRKTVQLYRYWLAYTKTRSDPMLVSPWEIVDMMKDRSIKDIGVLACEVDLTGEHEYKVGESEFRVPPSAVKSVKQAL